MAGLKEMMAQAVELGKQNRSYTITSADSPVKVIEWIHKMFNLSSADTFNMAGKFDELNETARVIQAQRLYDYYMGDLSQMQSHLERAMGKTFNAFDLAEMQFLFLPVSRMIIDKLCVAYSGKVVREAGENEKYEEIISASNIDRQAKHWYRMGRLFHTVLVRPCVRVKRGKKVLEYEVLTPNKYVVWEKPDNFYEPAAIAYAIQARDDDGQSCVNYAFWSDDEHLIVDANGKPVDDGNGKNRYGENPWTVLRMRETENFHGEGETVLVNVEEQVDVMLVTLMENLIMQGFGQPVLTNAELSGGVRVGPRWPMQLRSVDGVNSPDFKLVSALGHIKETQEAVDWLIERTATMYGLAKSSTMGESQSASGYAKLLDNWDLMESRSQDVDVLREFEKDLYHKTRLVCAKDGLGELPEADEFSVYFGDMRFPLDPKEEIETKKAKMSVGLWTPAWDLMEEDDTLTEEQAQAEVLRVKEMNKALGGEPDPVDPNEPKDPEDGGVVQ